MWEAFENLCQMGMFILYLLIRLSLTCLTCLTLIICERTGKSTQLDIDEIFQPKTEKFTNIRSPCSDKLYNNSQMFIPKPVFRKFLLFAIHLFM